MIISQTIVIKPKASPKVNKHKSIEYETNHRRLVRRNTASEITGTSDPSNVYSN